MKVIPNYKKLFDYVFCEQFAKIVKVITNIELIFLI